HGRTAELSIDAHVSLGHVLDRESILKGSTNLGASQRIDTRDRVNRFLDIRADKPRDAIIDDFGHGPGAERNYRRTASHGLDDRQSEWFRPIDREQQSSGVSEKLALLLFVDLADVFNEIAMPFDHRFNKFVPVRLIDFVDFRGNAQRHLAAHRDFNGVVWTFLR